MTTVEYRKCDQCNAERRLHFCDGWWILLDRDTFRETDGGEYDFCSIACLEAWTLSRHLNTGTDPVRIHQIRGVHR